MMKTFDSSNKDIYIIFNDEELYSKRFYVVIKYLKIFNDIS